MSSKRFSLVLTTSALALFSAAILAAPPGGGGGGRGMGGGSSGVAARAELDHASHAGASSMSSHGPNVNDQLADNTKLSSEIKELTGTDAQTACSGFKTLGDCMSAAHVSKNLDISFDTLKSKVTGSGAVSLGKAIHELRPDTDSKGAKKDADKQTKEDMKSSG